MVKNEDLEEIQRLAQEGKIGQVLIYVENLCDSVHRDGYHEGYGDGAHNGYMQGHEDGYNYGLTHDYELEF